MAELKNMTVQALRDLARKALGRGQSKLKTKAELIAALQAAERKFANAAGKAATRVKAATGRAARATEKMVESVRKGREERAQAKKAKAKAAPAGSREREKERRSAARGGVGKAAGGAARAMRDVAAAAKTGARDVAAAAKTGARDMAAAAKTGARNMRAAVRSAPEPDPEGYMVARVAGEDALRGAPHPMTEGAVEEKRAARAGAAEQVEPVPSSDVYQEHLGELPWSYADDALVALPRDPRTLFLYWDHAQETLRQAWEGLDGGKPQMWIFLQEPGGGWTRLRAVEFALESRSYYVHDLDPGRVYRAEIHLVDRLGRDKLVPRISNEMMLPPLGPSLIIDDRFMRILWGEPLQRLLRDAHPGGAFPDDVRAQLARLSDWSRFGGRVWGGSAGGMGGRPFSPASSPSAPSSPSSPWSRTDGEDR